MFSIASNELRRLFISPLAWAFLSLAFMILAYLFLTHIDNFVLIQGKLSAIPEAPGVTQLIISPLFNNAGTILLLIAPFITMRLIAEERRNESMPLLLSAPVSSTDIVLGKFLGTVIFFSIMLLEISLMPLSLYSGSSPDTGMLITGLLGLLLLTMTFTAIGLFFSSLTKQPILAAISTFTVLFVLWIIDWSGHQEQGVTLFSWLSLVRHFEPFLQGIINTSDIVYYLIMTVFFLVLTIRKLDNERLD